MMMIKVTAEKKSTTHFMAWISCLVDYDHCGLYSSEVNRSFLLVLTNLDEVNGSFLVKCVSINDVNVNNDNDNDNDK